jgi:hypothetical protein
MKRKGKYVESLIAAIVAFLLFPALLYAGGTSHEPKGAEAFLAGVVPPPGFYVKEYLNYYTADKLKNNSGETLSLSREGAKLDRLEALASVTRFIYTSPVQLWGGFLGAQLFVPVVWEHLKLQAATPAGVITQEDRQGGLGDLVFGPVYSWHSKDGLFHYALGLDIFAPTGQYNENKSLNVGTNSWTFAPVVGATLFLPWNPNLEFSVKMDYSFNTRNDDFIVSPPTAAKIGTPGAAGSRTYLSPGQEFHFDYAVAYALCKAKAPHQFRVGATGYFYQQITDDETGFGNVRNDKGRVLGIGPGLWWSYKKLIVEAHTAFETAVKNRPEGINTYVTVVYKFF